MYYRTVKPLNSQGEQYELQTPGGSVRFGVPFSELDTVFFGIGYAFAAPGDHLVEALIDDDPLKLDNRRCLAVPVPA